MEDLCSSVLDLQISEDSQKIADDNNFVIKSFRFPSTTNDKSKIVRIGAVQTSIIAETNACIETQRKAICEKVEKIVEVAAVENVNILCLPELWCELVMISYYSNRDLCQIIPDMPYPFYTPNYIQWQEFAEDVQSGHTTNILRRLAEKYKMVIISSILEREFESFYNTSVVVSTSGKLIGKYQKNLIPPIEEPYLQSGDFNNPVFDTEFGKIGILICYERHFPLSWIISGLKEAEIVFNPSAEDRDSLSERLWFIEGVNAASTNGFFTVLVNRTGAENFSNGERFSYFGSNYVASPDGLRTPYLDRDVDGILITEVDLSVCQKIKKTTSFHQKKFLKICVKKLNEMNFN